MIGTSKKPGSSLIFLIVFLAATLGMEIPAGGQTAESNGAQSTASATEETKPATAEGINENDLPPEVMKHLELIRQPFFVTGKVVDAETGAPLSSFHVIKGRDTGSGDRKYFRWRYHYAQANASGIFSASFDKLPHKHVIRIEALGYEPNISRAFDYREDSPTWDFKMKKGSAPSGSVVDNEGKPVSAAEVIVFYKWKSTVGIEMGRLTRASVCSVFLTNEDGDFTIDPQTEPFAIVALHKRGFAFLEDTEFANNSRIQLRQWGRVEGIVRVGTKPLKLDDSMLLSLHPRIPFLRDHSRLIFQYDGVSDESGQFVFDYVVPGDFYVRRSIRRGKSGYAPVSTVYGTLEPGQTLDVQVGGRGRPVIGRLVIPNTDKQKAIMDTGHSHIRNVKVGRIPAEIKKLSETNAAEASREFNKWANDHGILSDYPKEQFYFFDAHPDGTFRVEDVESGWYALESRLHQFDEDDPRGRGEETGRVRYYFVVPEMPGGRSDEPLDLGDIPVLDPQ